MIKTIILDLDGPILEGRERHYHFYADILNRHNYSPLLIDVYWEMKRSRCSVKEQLKKSGAELIHGSFSKEWISRIERPKYLVLDILRNDAIDKLKIWKLSGIEILLVTMRSNRESLLEQLRNFRLEKYFSSVIVCDYAQGGKGKAAALRKIVADIRPSTCLWIVDTEADLEGAKCLKSHVWLVSCGLRKKEFLLTLDPDFVSDSIIDVDLNKVNQNVA